MSMKKVHDKIEGDIARVGRSLMGVFGSKDSLEFTYTIGNALNGLPELLVIGTCQGNFLNDVSEKMIERGRKFDSDELVDLGGKCPVYVLDASPNVKDLFTILATNHLGTSDYAVMQVVMSDPNGVFPWQPGCEKPYADVHVYRVLNG